MDVVDIHQLWLSSLAQSATLESENQQMPGPPPDPIHTSLTALQTIPMVSIWLYFSIHL